MKARCYQCGIIKSGVCCCETCPRPSTSNLASFEIVCTTCHNDNHKRMKLNHVYCEGEFLCVSLQSDQPTLPVPHPVAHANHHPQELTEYEKKAANLIQLSSMVRSLLVTPLMLQLFEMRWNLSSHYYCPNPKCTARHSFSDIKVNCLLNLVESNPASHTCTAKKRLYTLLQRNDCSIDLKQDVDCGILCTFLVEYDKISPAQPSPFTQEIINYIDQIKVNGNHLSYIIFSF
jgi:hypothetical protein